MIPSAALVAALMQNRELRQCISNVDNVSPATYLADHFEFRRFALNTGERMTLSIARSECLVSQNSAFFVYREVGGGYRLVLEDNALEDVDAEPDGTISFAAHDTIDTIVEPVYVWNGSKYAFAPERSHVYDVPVEQRRPYELSVRFTPGTSSALLRGTYAINFGQTYAFVAKAGQRATIELLEGGRHAGVYLYFGEGHVASLDGNRWSGVLPYSGKYSLDVSGSDMSDPRTLLPYAIRLTIH